MKNYFIKMTLVVLIISIFINLYQQCHKIYSKNEIENQIIYVSAYNTYQRQVVYEGLTLEELSKKIEKYMNSTLNGKAEIIAKKALEANVDPVIASSIILVETGCQTNCSSLVKKCNNIGGMKGKGGCGSYARFSSLDAGIDAFIRNLDKGYFSKGLNTPALMNKKYAANPNWHKDVNYYVKRIKAS